MRCARSVVAFALASAGALALAAPALAATAPDNLGNGLSRLIEPGPVSGGIRLTMRPLAIRDAAGRVLVDVYAKDDAALPDVQRSAVAAGLRLVTVAREQKAVEGFLALDDVEAVAAAPGVATVSQVPKPQANVGAVTSQGVRAHRADRVPAGIDGSGVTVAALSDSFDVAATAPSGQPLTVHAADDIRTGDLPAAGVTVIDENPSRGATDEGRAMLQIAHDVAPGARECFATALLGELSFAHNIRALADKSGAVRRGRDRGRHRLLRRAVLQPRADRRCDRRRRRPRRALLHRCGQPGRPAGLPVAAADRPAGRRDRGHEHRPQRRRPGALRGRLPRLRRRPRAGHRAGHRRRRLGRPRSPVGRSAGAQRAAARRSAPADDRRAHHGQSDGDDPVRGHRGPAHPRDHRRDPLRLDRSRPDAARPGRRTAEGGRHGCDPGVDRHHPAGKRHVHVPGARLRRRARGLHVGREAGARVRP